MDRADFLRLLSQDFYPQLRREGFGGSGRRLRRADAPFHHVVEIQAAGGGEGCYVNLGAHVEGLPEEGGAPFDPATLDEPGCAFRSRLTLPDGSDRWPYGGTEDEVRATIASLRSAWEQQGGAWWSRFSSDDATARLADLVDDLADAHPAQSLKAARLAGLLGDDARAHQIATAALPRVPDRATALRADLEDFLPSR